jgi:hypothetical protein
MLATKSKPFAEVGQLLSRDEKIFIIGCSECATTSRTGGEPEVLAMKERLEKEGKTVTGWVIIAPCISAQVIRVFAQKRGEISAADGILVMACGSGVQCVRENERLGKRVHPALDTIFSAIVDRTGNIEERCSACGECVLGRSGVICPLTRCPKGLLNGPCGGTNHGKCEVDKEKDCAWTLIYQELNKLGDLSFMREIQPPKNYQVMTRPHRIGLEPPKGGAVKK